MPETNTDDVPEVDQEIEIIAPADDILRIKDNIRNVQSSVEVLYLYNKLRKMGPWVAEDITMDFIFDNDALHSALVMAYGRIFTTGPRKIARKKVPIELRPIHDELIDLRNKRYAHNDRHESVETLLDFEFDGSTIILKTGLSLQIVFGAPEHWKQLFDWLNIYLHDQLESQLKRLSDETGYKWEQVRGPVPSWVADAE